MLSRLDELVDRLYEIVGSEEPDRMDAIKLIFEIAGMNDIHKGNSPHRPTYQQINQYFADK